MNSEKEKCSEMDTPQIPDKQAKKGKRGRKKGVPYDALPKWKTTYMFVLWCESQSVEYVARQGRVAAGTVRRYRRRHRWDERYANLMASVRLKEGGEEEELARQSALQKVRLLKGQAFEALIGMEYANAKDAANAFERFQVLESRMLGESPPTTINLIMIAAEQFQKLARKQDPKRIEAEVTDVE